MTPYLQQEILHTLFALAVTATVAIAADLATIQSFETVSLSGLAVTGIRSVCTAVVTLGSRYVIKPK